MKSRSYIIFLAVFFIFTNAHALDFDSFSKMEDTQTALVTKYSGLTAQQITELTTFFEKATTAPEKPMLIGADSTINEDCSHCPKHLQLTGEINKVLEAMKVDPVVSKEEEVPVSINRLKFLYYTVKTREEDGSVRCARYNDNSIIFKPSKLDGQMDLMAQNVFKFSGITSAQLMDPKKEEVVYYYRGEGDQRNIVVQAIIGKDGGKFRYYYYRPTEKENNPYNLPDMGGDKEADVTLKKVKLRDPMILQTEEDKMDDKNKFKLAIDPTFETRMKVIPKNLQVAQVEASQNVGGVDGIRVNADSKLTLKGNEANMDLQTEKGTTFVKLAVLTNLKGETSRTVTVPYEVKLGAEDDKEAVKLKGKVMDSTTEQVVTLSLTDTATTYVRTEIKKIKLTNINTYLVAKDFSIDKDQMATLAVGKNEEKSKYVSFQHRKAIKDNITMVLDVRIDENKKASISYQLKARF